MGDQKPVILIELTTEEAGRLKKGLEKCFKMEPSFKEDELEGLERAYDKLMGLE